MVNSNSFMEFTKSRNFEFDFYSLLFEFITYLYYKVPKQFDFILKLFNLVLRKFSLKVTIINFRVFSNIQFVFLNLPE